jgi:hypothetical protein
VEVTDVERRAGEPGVAIEEPRQLGAGPVLPAPQGDVGMELAIAQLGIAPQRLIDGQLQGRQRIARAQTHPQHAGRRPIPA